jgi:hypothetical protein
MLVPIRSSFACGARDLPGDHLPRLRYSAWHSARRLFGVDLRGFFALKDGVRAGFNDVRGTVHLQSNAPLAELARLKEAVDAHCPVLDILRAPVSVKQNPALATSRDGTACLRTRLDPKAAVCRSTEHDDGRPLHGGS